MKGFAQVEEQLDSEEASFGISAIFHQGAILPHRKIVSEIVGEATKSFELSVYKNTFGKKDWQQLHNYPRFGVSVIAMNLGNEKELGNGYGVFSFIELPSNHQRKISWNIKLGYGLGYIEKPFDRETNFKNVAIGSNFNALIYANSSWSVKFYKSVKLSLGLSMVHFSNASSARPNLGINILSLNSGLSYAFGEKEKFVASKIDKRPRKWVKSLRGTFGVKEIPPAAGPKYFVSAYSFDFMKARAQKSSFGFGTDLFYNTSLTQAIENDSSSTLSSFNNFRVGVSGIYAFDFGRVSLAVEVGVYVFSRYKKNGLIYNRFFTKFNASEKLFFTVGLKTHYAVADFPEFGIGYNFN
ncbi:MAG: acyloxyacyl hydrolase [Flavobacteriales bacterium]